MKASITPAFKPARTLLFVPGNRESWIAKVPGYASDVIILDLEDSVPAGHKAMARELVAASIPGLAQAGVRVFVRINRGPDGYDTEDVRACVVPGLEGLVLPKPIGPEDVQRAGELLDAAERGAGAQTRASLIPTLETARSLHFAYECAMQDRVVAIFGAIAKNADVSRSVGFQWTEGGLETLYLRSRAVIAARAAGKLPLGGCWQKVHDLDGLREAARFNRTLGMTGEMILHPSNAPIVNEVYSPSPEDIAYYGGMITAFEQAVAQGRASVMYDGEHIDVAHVQTARDILALQSNP